MAKVTLKSDAPKGAGKVSYGNDEYEAPFETYDAAVIAALDGHPYFDVADKSAPDPEAEAAAERSDDSFVELEASESDLVEVIRVRDYAAENVQDAEDVASADSDESAAPEPTPVVTPPAKDETTDDEERNF